MPAPNDHILLIDLKTVEELARRKHGKMFTEQVTKTLVKDNSYFARLERPGWELTYNRPISMGYLLYLTLIKSHSQSTELRSLWNYQSHGLSVLSLSRGRVTEI
jgi:hypothetical protein